MKASPPRSTRAWRSWPLNVSAHRSISQPLRKCSCKPCADSHIATLLESRPCLWLCWS